MPSFFRDERGALALEKIPAKSYSEFHAWLSHQAEMNDGKSFRDPYRDLLEDREFAPLLRAIYEGNASPSLTSLANQFEDTFIRIDPDRFVSERFSSREGRSRLRHLLSGKGASNPGIAADLAKSVARVAEQEKTASELEIHWVTGKISLWNYWNLGLSPKDIGDAADGAVGILNSSDFFFDQQDLRANKEGLQWEFVSLLEDPQTGLPALSPEEFQKYLSCSSQRPSAIPSSRLQSLASELIVVLANNRYWDGAKVPDQAGAMRVRALREIREIFQLAGQVDSPETLQVLNERLRNYFQGSLGEGDLGDKIRHLAIGHGWEELFQDLPGEQRKAFQDFKRLSDSYHFSAEMGETLRFEFPQGPAGELAQGLDSAKHQLWYQYKQHKALSRGLSQIAKHGADQGDIQDIEHGARFFDHLIESLHTGALTQKKAGDIQDFLYEAFRPGGVLSKAYQAAEMDGGEQLLSLVQTCLEMVAIAAATEGLGLSGELAEVGQGLNRISRMESFAQGAWVGFGRGATLSLSENALAVASGEVRQGPETLSSWVKDAVATGGAMSLSNGVQRTFLQQPQVQQGLMQNLIARYSRGVWKAARHFSADTALEFTEEALDQYSRRVLDGNTQALSRAELEETFAVTLAGGGLQQGVQGGLNHGFAFDPIYPPILKAAGGLCVWALPAIQNDGNGDSLASLFLGLASAGMIAMTGEMGRGEKAGEDEIDVRFQAYLAQDPNLRGELESGSLTETQLRPYLERHAALRGHSADIAKFDSIAMQGLTEGLKAFRSLPWTPEMKVQALAILLEAWAKDRKEAPDYFEKIYGVFVECQLRLGDLNWDETRKYEFLRHIAAHGDSNLVYTFEIIANVLQRNSQDWTTEGMASIFPGESRGDGIPF
ncbi:MAG: hypothetical protein K8R69_02130 [Deltaproteobacteria bacterium]|nr:hypothetical protein [Deltaproteobacteria bacterium]